MTANDHTTRSCPLCGCENPTGALEEKLDAFLLLARDWVGTRDTARAELRERDRDIAAARAHCERVITTFAPADRTADYRGQAAVAHKVLALLNREKP